MSELLTIEEMEKLAYKVWYAQFEKEARVLLENHKKSIDSEFSLFRKYKSEIYAMFEALKSTQKEVKGNLKSCEYAQRNIFNKLDEIKDMHKKIQHIERKLSYALGEPYDKRNIKKELKEQMELRPKDIEE